MLFPKYALEDLTIGSGSIIGKGNIEEFFNHVSMHKDVEDRSLAELAPSYEVAAAYLVHMLEARFVNLNPFMQQMFLSFMISKTPKRKILLWRLCVENLEMLLLKLEKFLSVLICLAHLLMLLVQPKKISKYQFLATCRIA
jgi:hypothetical protein